MARGRKDYEQAVVAVESEGSVNPHGRILMYDDFEDTPLKWRTIGSGTHFETRQAAAAYNGGFGLRLDLTAAVPGVPDLSRVFRYIPIDVTKRLLLELFWRVHDLGRLQYLRIYMIFYDGNRRHYTQIRYDRVAGAWEYWTDGGAWALIPGAAQTFYNRSWNELSLSADFATDEHVIFKSNNLEVNMGGLLCQNTFSGFGAHAEIWISVNNDTANQLLVDIDDVVVRELEV